LNTFATLGLAEPILRAVTRQGYTTPTPIQERAIPALIAGQDLLGIAQTGTGKTAAFALPILHRLSQDKHPLRPRSCRALVLAPTRELAAQIAESFTTYGQFLRLSVALVIGGARHGPQIKAMARGADIVVATPGRLIDHIEAGNLRLDTTKIIVLDEADHMLDLGFIIPIRRIMKMLPAEKQSLLLSATMPGPIASLAEEHLRNPHRVAVSPGATTVEKVNQQVYLVDAASKRSLLIELLSKPEFSRVLVFTRTKRGADKVTAHLESAGLRAAAIHGNKSQSQRERALDGFKKGHTRILVATDIAARGVDVDAVSHVVNFELPNVPESYVHRIGRTARAGASGTAISFCDGTERGMLKDIEKATRQTLPTLDRQGRSVVAPPAPRQAHKPDSSHRGRSFRPRRGRIAA
jgi:ATP-dependent RNA helicase RhlE